jgi:hypothetical protein
VVVIEYITCPNFIGCFQTGCFAPGSTVLLAPIKALPCLCIFPPMAEKYKPPDLRVVGDSGGLMGVLLLLANSISSPIIMNLFQ